MRRTPDAVLSGLMAGGGRFCRVVAGMGRGVVFWVGGKKNSDWE